MKQTIKNIFYNLARFLQVQLFVSLASFPILVAWGLPLSLMTAAGNLLFSPFLTAFLLCASLVFFTECLSLPNAWLCFILNKITDVWLWSLGWGQKSWLIGFYKPSYLFLGTIIIVAFLIIQHKRLGKLFPSICALSCLLFFSSGYLLSTKPHNTHYSIECGKKNVTIVITNGTVELHDNGAFSKKLSPDSWIQYTLLSELIKNSGTTHIDHIIITHPGALTFHALCTLCTHITVKKITVPYFNKELSKYGWRKFFEFKRIVEKENIQLVRQ